MARAPAKLKSNPSPPRGNSPHAFAHPFDSAIMPPARTCYFAAPRLIGPEEITDNQRSSWRRTFLQRPIHSLPAMRIFRIRPRNVSLQFSGPSFTHIPSIIREQHARTSRLEPRQAYVPPTSLFFDESAKKSTNKPPSPRAWNNYRNASFLRSHRRRPPPFSNDIFHIGPDVPLQSPPENRALRSARKTRLKSHANVLPVAAFTTMVHTHLRIVLQPLLAHERRLDLPSESRAASAPGRARKRNRTLNFSIFRIRTARITPWPRMEKHGPAVRRPNPSPLIRLQTRRRKLPGLATIPPNAVSRHGRILTPTRAVTVPDRISLQRSRSHDACPSRPNLLPPLASLELH